MKWIFECQNQQFDQYCIRQYVFFGSALVVFLFSLYSIVKLFFINVHAPKFQLIILSTNTITTVGISVAQAQQENYNSIIVLLIIQIYSYSLLSYAYTKLYLISIVKARERLLKKIQIGYIVFSIGMGTLLIGAIIYLQFANTICNENQLTYIYLGLTCCELPIFVIAFYFIYKTKISIRQLENQKQMDKDGQKLLLGDDTYIKIKYLQSDFTLLCFTASVLIHIAAVIFLFVQPIQCDDAYVFNVKNAKQLTTMILIDIANLLPHILMPVIFYLIPGYFERRGQRINIEQGNVQKQCGQQANIFQSDYFPISKIKESSQK